MNHTTISDSNQDEARTRARLADARGWFVRLAAAPRPQDMADFRTWLAADPRNGEAFARASALWEGLADVEQIETLLTDRDNVTPFPARQVTRRMWIGGAVAAAFACAATTGVLLVRPATGEAVLLQTQNGEIRSFTLADGSTVTLGGASRVAGTMTGTARTLELEAGNAYFDIARDEARPLTVTAGGYEVRVLGTRFDIRTYADRISVAVDHGHVEVAEGDGAAADLLAGDKIAAWRAGGLGPVQAFDAEREFAWRTGRLSFVDAPLRDIVSDMNQYSARPIRLAPGAPADLRLTLSFSTDQIGAVLTGLDSGYPLEVASSTDEILISGEH